MFYYFEVLKLISKTLLGSFRYSKILEPAVNNGTNKFFFYQSHLFHRSI